MADTVEIGFRRAASRLLPSGAAVLAAVSGGGDSIALLHLLARFSRSAKLSLAVAHLDHGLRRGSRTDRLFVHRTARQLSLPCFSDRRDVDTLKRRDESPEEAARRVRRTFLLETLAECGADFVATGHTLDDQAETVLMRLVRGAGAAALAGMAESGPGPFVRPLLGFERRVLRDWLARRKVSFREDPSNRDLRFDRNRARRLVLPVLQQTLNPRAARHLVKAADLLRRDAVYLDEVAESVLPELSREDDGNLILDAARLERTAAPISFRVVCLALRAVGVDSRRIAARHIEAVLALARGAGGKELHLPGRVRASRVRAEILLRPGGD